MCKIKCTETRAYFSNKQPDLTGGDADYPHAHGLGVFWALRAGPALGALSCRSRARRRPWPRIATPRTLDPQRAFPSRADRAGADATKRAAEAAASRPLRRGLRPPVEVNPPHPFLSPARPPSALRPAQVPPASRLRPAAL